MTCRFHHNGRQLQKAWQRVNISRVAMEPMVPLRTSELKDQLRPVKPHAVGPGVFLGNFTGACAQLVQDSLDLSGFCGRNGGRLLLGHPAQSTTFAL